MRATVLRPEHRTGRRRRPAEPAVRAVITRMGRYRLELGWVAFLAVDYAAMFRWPQWQTLPFYLIWISLTLLYGLKVWPLPPTLVLLAAVMVLTGIPIATHVMGGTDAVVKMIRVPLMAALFLAVAWHARRRVEAVRTAESGAAELRSMLDRQERFIHDASHELRTPVTIARGHVELAAESSGARAELEVAVDELSRIDAIIGRLLLLASAGQPDFLETEEVDVEGFLEDIFMRWSGVAPRAWRLGALAEGRLRVDPDRLRAALDALLENAVKFTHERDAIELRAAPDGSGHIVIEVRDEGCGVRQEALGRIFDRFARADAARTRADGGVGLGLAIVDAIAKRHGGRCTVTSTPRGSVFALTLPGFRPADSAQRATPRRGLAPASAPGAPELLLGHPGELKAGPPPAGHHVQFMGASARPQPPAAPREVDALNLPPLQAADRRAGGALEYVEAGRGDPQLQVALPGPQGLDPAQVDRRHPQGIRLRNPQGVGLGRRRGVGLRRLRAVGLGRLRVGRIRRRAHQPMGREHRGVVDRLPEPQPQLLDGGAGQGPAPQGAIGVRHRFRRQPVKLVGAQGQAARGRLHGHGIPQASHHLQATGVDDALDRSA